jgi:lysophospholipid acyltransferase (LPLAT)-like uncharacterized protein
MVWAFLSVLAATIRFRFKDNSNYFKSSNEPPVIFCVWHNRLPLTMTGYFGFVRKRQRHSTVGLAAMVSASKDGALLAAILQRFKVYPVRGSSSRRGRQALLELTTSAQKGYDLAITPDGPRGPCYKIQEGVMSLAQVTGLAIVPASFNLKWKIQANSWDRFQIPLPFSRCEMVLEKPIVVPREASDSERDKLREELERRLMEITID